jgi:hypothetical protein
MKSEICCEKCGKPAEHLITLKCGCKMIYCKYIWCDSYMHIGVIHCQKHWDLFKFTLKDQYKYNRVVKEIENKM